MTRKEAFAEAITNNMYDLVSYTYRVSKQYADDDPDLALSYDSRRHRLNVTVHDRAVDIPLKYNRLNAHITAELFDEAKRFARDAYPSKGVLSVYDNRVINDTHALCIKHIDYNRESPKEEAFFTFDASDGEFNSVIQTRDKPIWRGVIQHHAKSDETYTLVDAHCDRYGHLNESTRLSYIREETTDKLGQWNKSLDISLRSASDDNKRTNTISLRDYMNRPDTDSVETPVILSFGGLDEQDHAQEM